VLTGLAALATFEAHEPTPAPEEEPVQQAPASGRSTDFTDWQGAALSKLKALIASVNNIEAMKAEAEKIHGALTIMETRGVPDLPWKRRKAPQQAVSAPPVQRLDDMRCARCGRVFENRMQYKLGPGGTHICKGHCAPAPQVSDLVAAG
jgi:hypothetical protein